MNTLGLGQQARAVFEAVEQARVEAIGARRMDGVAQNLTAMLDERFHRGKFDKITDRADAPIEDALALMVRERLTGMSPPPAAKRLVDLWRPLIEDRAGSDLDRLENLVEDQRQFSDVVHDLLDALEMGEDRSHDSEDEDEGEEDRRKQESGEDGEAADSDEMQRMSMEDTQVSSEDMPDAAAEAAEAPTADMADDSDMGDAETPASSSPAACARVEQPLRNTSSRFRRCPRNLASVTASFSFVCDPAVTLRLSDKLTAAPTVPSSAPPSPTDFARTTARRTRPF